MGLAEPTFAKQIESIKYFFHILISFLRYNIMVISSSTMQIFTIASPKGKTIATTLI